VFAADMDDHLPTEVNYASYPFSRHWRS
jgi:hypothetical protein